MGYDQSSTARTVTGAAKVVTDSEALLASIESQDAMLFDLDGVVAQSTALHGQLWKQVFDEFLARFEVLHRLPFRPFDARTDYHDFVDGRSRYDGVVNFLASRGIDLPLGEPGDDGDADTCRGLGNRKNRLFLARMEKSGVPLFPSTVALIQRLSGLGKTVGMVSTSNNAEAVLEKAGIRHLFDVIVSGREAAAMGLAAKPAPDTYLKAAELAGSTPARSVGFEDSVVGVRAANGAGVGLIVGIDRNRDREALLRHGAHAVVADLSELME
jgi:alpha,alpha-trehalase